MNIPCYDAFEERAAIQQYEAGMSRWLAEEEAARAQGYPTAIAIKRAFKVKKGLCMCPLCVGGDDEAR